MGNCQNSAPTENTKTFEKERKNRNETVSIKATTWARNSHGLFDYEARDVFTNDLKMKYPGFFYRRSNQVVMKSDNENVTPEEHEILHVTSADSFLWVEPHSTQPNPSKQQPSTPNQENESNELNTWIVIKSLKTTQLFQKGYKLKEKDLLKLGRVRFRVKEICTDAKKRPNFHDLSRGPVHVADRPSMLKLNESARNQPVCRICLSETWEEDNPLLNPCKCAGTMKYIHIKCLQQWLRSRLQTRDTAIAFTIAWKNLDCELCKKPFPSLIEYDGQRYSPLELPRGEASAYIMFEVLGKDPNQVRGLHFINLGVKKEIKLGRGHESDVRIPDISVSRFHATLTLDEGNVYLNDNDSKFGTLVQLRKKFPLISEIGGLSLQIGRSTMSFNFAQNSTHHSTPGINPAGLVPNGVSNPKGNDNEQMMIFELNYEVDIEAKEEEQDVTANNPAVEGEDNLARPQVSLMDIIRNNPQLSIPNAQPVPNQNIEDMLYDGPGSPMNNMNGSNLRGSNLNGIINRDNENVDEPT